MVLRRARRSPRAPAIGPSRSAVRSVTRKTPPTEELLTTPEPFVRLGASAASARMLSQSPRLDRDSAIHRARNGLIDSTPSPERARFAVGLGGTFSGLSRRGVEREFTA